MKNNFEIHGDTTVIFVSRKGITQKVFIDTEDLELVSEFNGTWHLDNRGYIKRVIKKKHDLMHRLLMNPPEDRVVDHIDGDALNNRKSNLRVLKPSENTQNLRHLKVKAKSKIKGVQLESRWGEEKWRARISVFGNDVSLGYYPDIEDARIASIIGRIIYHPHSREAGIYKRLVEEKREF